MHRVHHSVIPLTIAHIKRDTANIDVGIDTDIDTKIVNLRESRKIQSKNNLKLNPELKYNTTLTNGTPSNIRKLKTTGKECYLEYLLKPCD